MSFSIIIPHKNSTKLLQRCLDSIPNREDLEIIVVDDNSDLTVEESLKFPGLEKPNTHVVFTNESRGAGYARNVGLDLAKGDWILFADSDDFFTKELSFVLDRVNDSKEDIIFFKHHCVLSDDVSVEANRSNELNDYVDLFLGHSADAEFLLRLKWGVPWAKIIRKQIIDNHHIHFSESRYANDVFFSAQTGVLANSIKALNDDIYVVTVRNGSLSSNFCGTSKEVEIRLTEALKTDCFIRNNTHGRKPALKTEADVILWYIYHEKGSRYLWECAKDCFFDISVFRTIIWFMIKRGIKR